MCGCKRERCGEPGGVKTSPFPPPQPLAVFLGASGWGAGKPLGSAGGLLADRHLLGDKACHSITACREVHEKRVRFYLAY